MQRPGPVAGEGNVSVACRGVVGAVPTSTKVGSVSRARYEEIIAGDRELIEVSIRRSSSSSATMLWRSSRCVRTAALYRRPARIPLVSARRWRRTRGCRRPLQPGAAEPADGEPVAGRVPGEGVSFEIHRIPEKLEDRFERITNPPQHPQDGALHSAPGDAQALGYGRRGALGAREEEFSSGLARISAREPADRRHSGELAFRVGRGTGPARRRRGKGHVRWSGVRRPLGDLGLRLCGEFGGQGGVVGF